MISYGAAVERIIIALAASFAVYLGYRLFHITQEKQGKLLVNGKDYRFQLADVAPGIYFAVFGSFVLIVALFRPMGTYQSQSRTENGTVITQSGTLGISGGTQASNLSAASGGVQTDFTLLFRRTFTEQDLKKMQTLLQIRELLRDTPDDARKLWRPDVLQDLRSQLKEIVVDKPFNDVVASATNLDDLYVLVESYIPYFFLKHSAPMLVPVQH